MSSKPEINNKLSKGVVTQNGHYISYKTDCYTDWNSFFQQFYYELRQFLILNNIAFKDGDFMIHKADDSASRKGCVTISIEMDLSVRSVGDEMKDGTELPFQSDSVN